MLNVFIVQQDSIGALPLPAQSVSEESLDINALMADAMDDTEESVRHLIITCFTMTYCVR